MSRSDILWGLKTGAVIGLIFALLLLGGWKPASAAPRVETTCGWDGTILWAAGLPDEWTVTRTLYPTGVSPRPSTFSADFGTPFTAYFWTRKGPGMPGAPKPGAGLNDYKVICIAEAP